MNPYVNGNESKIHKFDSLLHVRALGYMKDEFKDQMMAEVMSKYSDTNNAKLDKMLRVNRF